MKIKVHNEIFIFDLSKMFKTMNIPFNIDAIGKTSQAQGGQFFQPVKINFTTVVEGHPRIICTKLFRNQTGSFCKEDFKEFFLVAMATRILHGIF